MIANLTEKSGDRDAARRLRFEALDTAIPAAVKALYAACGLHVVVSKANEDDQGDYPPWISFRAELARAELEGTLAS